MKKLSNIDNIEFVKNHVLLSGIPIDINVNVFEWLNKYCDIPYSSKKYIQKYPEHEEYSFAGIVGIYIYTKNSIINRISVYPFIPNDSRYYNGDVILFGKKITKPLMSVDIEKYFTDIKIVQPDRGYWERFKAHESVIYNINDTVEIDIMMNRDPKYVGGISLRIKQY